jgi:hypothetical protein
MIIKHILILPGSHPASEEGETTMKYLHIVVHDAARHGDYDPAMRRAEEDREIKLRRMSVEELVASGYGWVTDGPLSRSELVNTYNGFRSEEITEAQAARHATASAALNAEFGIVEGGW